MTRKVLFTPECVVTKQKRVLSAALGQHGGETLDPRTQSKVNSVSSSCSKMVEDFGPGLMIRNLLPKPFTRHSFTAHQPRNSALLCCTRTRTRTRTRTHTHTQDILVTHTNMTNIYRQGSVARLQTAHLGMLANSTPCDSGCITQRRQRTTYSTIL